MFERMMRDLARLRRAVGRKPHPRLAIIDTQTVKYLSVRGPRGYDAAMRVVGRKRVALVDAEGHWLAVAVVPASVQERNTLTALDDGKAAWPSLRVATLDGAITAERCQVWSNLHGMRHEVVTRPPDRKGFAVRPRRWVVERSFGWLTHWGSLLRDRAGRLDVAAARIRVRSRPRRHRSHDQSSMTPLKQALRRRSRRQAVLQPRREELGTPYLLETLVR